MKSSERGFTLVEIMIVVAIIALLAAVAIPNVLRGRTTANESAAIGNIRALISSLEMYRSVNQAYPSVNAGAFQDQMYGTDCAGSAPTPDFGPPSFCKEPGGPDGAAASEVQGFVWLFAGTAPTRRPTTINMGITLTGKPLRPNMAASSWKTGSAGGHGSAGAYL